jgi:F-type H+-transporting ATPase subunit a
MSEHFTYLSPIIADPDQQKFIAALAVGIGILFVGRKLASRIESRSDIDAHIIPAEKINSFGVFDFFIGAFVNFQDSILGKENRRYLPFTLSVFLFVLTCNLLGLIPGFPAITTSTWVTVAIAATIFVYFNYHGVREQGIVSYLKHFAGPIWWLAVVIFPLEILSVFLRILTLNLRLYWNITADHLVLENFAGILGIFSFPLYILGTFVSFMQAFVLTTLTMVYILLATQHEEGH